MVKDPARPGRGMSLGIDIDLVKNGGEPPEFLADFNSMGYIF